jgi:hypothetical protein
MGYDPPGLDHRPEDRALIGFGSLMPQPDNKRGLVRRVVTLPLKIVALPLKAVGAVLRLPGRLFRRTAD